MKSAGWHLDEEISLVFGGFKIKVLLVGQMKHS